MIVAHYHIEQLLQVGAAGILIFPGDHAVERRQGHLVSTGDLEREETLARLQRHRAPLRRAVLAAQPEAGG